MLEVDSTLHIPAREFSFVFSRSPGPGGQNVNKVNSRATLRWRIVDSPNVPEDVRERFVSTFRRRITQDGTVVLHSHRFRDQNKNVADCLEKLHSMLKVALSEPKKRRSTRPSQSSRESRMREKRIQSERKVLRRPPNPEEG